MDAVQEVGEFLRLHLDNMDLSGRDPDDGQGASASPAMPVPRTVHKAIAYVAVAPSDEMADLFRQCGADAVLRGGQTMNPSAAEFVSAFDTLDADSILVLPNNKNVYGAATQAAALSGRAVTVLPAYSPAQGYFALSSVLLDCTDPEEQQAAMLAGMEGVCSLSFARAVRSCTVCGVCCREGELLGLAEDTPVAAAPTLCEVLPLTLAQVDGIADKAICVLFPGAALSGEEAEALAETIRALYPHLEVGLLPGGQPAYDLMAGLL